MKKSLCLIPLLCATAALAAGPVAITITGPPASRITISGDRATGITVQQPLNATIAVVHPGPQGVRGEGVGVAEHAALTHTAHGGVSQTLVGTTSPADSTGNLGDFYINTLTTEYYKKELGSVNVALTGTVTTSSSRTAAAYSCGAGEGSQYINDNRFYDPVAACITPMGYDSWVSSGTPSLLNPEWVEIAFPGTLITQIDIFTERQSVLAPVAVTLATTFADFTVDGGIKDFRVQYWNGASWVDHTSYTNNDKVWQQLISPNITTDKLRIFITKGSSAAWSDEVSGDITYLGVKARISELKIWTTAPVWVLKGRTVAYRAPTIAVAPIAAVEFGTTRTSVPLNWSIIDGSMALTSQSLNNGIGTISTTSRAYTHTTSFTGSRTYTVSVTDGATDQTGSTDAGALLRRYWGASANTTLTDAEIRGLSGSILAANFAGFSGSITASNQYLYIATYYAAGTIKINGFTDSSFVKVRSSSPFVNGVGYNTTINLYRSANRLTGTYTVQVIE